MSDITEFLLARIDEDERHARKLAETDCRPALSLATTINHPQRLLAECEAKRAILKEHDTVPTAPGRSDTTCAGCGLAFNARPCPTLAHLAAVYTDHPDYREEWKTLTEK